MSNFFSISRGVRQSFHYPITSFFYASKLLQDHEITGIKINGNHFTSTIFADAARVINPFKTNGISHCYPLDQSICVSMVVGWYF